MRNSAYFNVTFDIKGVNRRFLFILNMSFSTRTFFCYNNLMKFLLTKGTKWSMELFFARCELLLHAYM